MRKLIAMEIEILKYNHELEEEVKQITYTIPLLENDGSIETTFYEMKQDWNLKDVDAIEDMMFIAIGHMYVYGEWNYYTTTVFDIYELETQTETVSYTLTPIFLNL